MPGNPTNLGDFPQPVKIDPEHGVEGGVVRLGDRRQLHDSGVVHHQGGLAEPRFRLVEQAHDLGRLADIGLDGGGSAVRGQDVRNDGLRGVDVRRIVHRHGKPVPGQAFCNLGPDPSRGACDDRDRCWTMGHEVLLQETLRSVKYGAWIVNCNYET
jgi:hypothetical protein